MRLFAAVVRVVLEALLGRPRGSIGVAALAALYQLLPGVEEATEGAERVT